MPARVRGAIFAHQGRWKATDHRGAGHQDALERFICGDGGMSAGARGMIGAMSEVRYLDHDGLAWGTASLGKGLRW